MNLQDDVYRGCGWALLLCAIALLFVLVMGLVTVEVVESKAVESSTMDDSLHVMASIFQGEAPPGNSDSRCTMCDEIIACNVAEGEFWRWYVYAEPTNYAYQMVLWALEDDNCKDVPECYFVGNATDVPKWAKHNWITEAKIYCNAYGCTSCANLVQPLPLEN